MISTLPANMTAEEKAAMGAQLSAAAYAEPPIVPRDLALTLIIVASIIMGLVTVVVSLRCYVRIIYKNTKKGYGWGWEDTFALLGYVVFMVSSIFGIKAAFYGLGTLDSKLNASLIIRCTEYMLYSQDMYGLSMPLIKASILCTLIRFTIEPRYRYILYTMQLLATITAITGILVSLLFCKPIAASWNPLLGKCGDFKVVVIIGYTWTGVGIATDWAYVVLPWLVVRKVQMSRRSKVTVMIIIGLGGMASTATMVRAPYLKYYLFRQDRTYWHGHITIWCIVESGLGLIAASLPALRSLFIGFFENTQKGSRNSGTDNTACYRQRTQFALQTIGGSSYNTAPLQRIASTSQNSGTSISDDQRKRLGDNTSSQSLMSQEQNVGNEADSIVDMEIGHTRDNHASNAV